MIKGRCTHLFIALTLALCFGAQEVTAATSPRRAGDETNEYDSESLTRPLSTREKARQFLCEHRKAVAVAGMAYLASVVAEMSLFPECNIFGDTFSSTGCFNREVALLRQLFGLGD